MQKSRPKEKPLYRRKLPVHDDTLLVHATPLAPARFELRDDGTIAARTAQEQKRAPVLLFHDEIHGIWLYRGNCFELLDAIAAKYPEGRFDCIFADPPYFLSNGGITCHAGRMVKVDKGDWDKSRGPELNHEFNLEWLRRCQRVLKPNGTIWVTGTHHVIFSIGFAMQQLGFKILNDIAWEKPNPPPNLSCRYFTHSTETIIWAAKNEKSKHTFNYAAMKAVTGKQMKTVWRRGEFALVGTSYQPIPAGNLPDTPVGESPAPPEDMGSIWTIPPPSGDEKTFGKHPTQKPIALVERCLLASTNEGDLVLDPFLGSGTTAVACIRLKRRCIGIDMDGAFVALAAKRVDREVVLIWLREIKVQTWITLVDPHCIASRRSAKKGIFLDARVYPGCKQYDLDLDADSINGSGCVDDKHKVQTDCIWQEIKFVFLSCAEADRAQVIHTAVDVSLESAWANAPMPKRCETTHIVTCETQILRVKNS